MDKETITSLLHAWEIQGAEAWHELVPVIYQELHKLARYQLQNRGEWQTTELLHETLLRLESQNQVHWQNRKHFFCVAATLMRRIMIDQARQRKASKRGGHSEHFSLSDLELNSPLPDPLVLNLDEALKALAQMDQPLTRLVELRVFGGFTIEETSSILERSIASVKRDWETARIWLYDYLAHEP